MPKCKYMAPVQHKGASFLWNGFTVKAGNIYGRDGRGLYVMENYYVYDTTTRTHYVRMFRRIKNTSGKGNMFTWLLIAANDGDDKTVKKIIGQSRFGDFYMKDNTHKDEIRVVENKDGKRMRIPMNSYTKPVHDDTRPHNSRSDCWCKKHYKVSRASNPAARQSESYALHSYRLYGSMSKAWADWMEGVGPYPKRGAV